SSLTSRLLVLSFCVPAGVPLLGAFEIEAGTFACREDAGQLPVVRAELGELLRGRCAALVEMPVEPLILPCNGLFDEDHRGVERLALRLLRITNRVVHFQPSLNTSNSAAVNEQACERAPVRLAALVFFSQSNRALPAERVLV